MPIRRGSFFLISASYSLTLDEIFHLIILFKINREENTDIEDVAGGDMVLDIENTDMEVESGENFTGPGITQISSMTESESVLKADKVIAYEEQLLQLASTKINDKCIVKGCSETLKLSTKYVASAMYIVWVCT